MNLAEGSKRGQKRKMSAHVVVVGDGTADVSGSKKHTLGAPSRCKLNGSGSTKSGGDVDYCSCSLKASASAAGNHEYAAVIRSADPADRGVVCRFTCGLGDVWLSKYPTIPPLGKKCVVTGDTCVDAAVKELSKLNYHCLNVIERGTFSTVFHAYNDDSRQSAAIKLLNKGAHACKRKLRSHVPCTSVPPGSASELEVLKDLRHPHIIAFLGHYYTANGHLGLILEFCENGNLADLLKMRKVGFLTEAVSLRYFRQMISPLEYLHASGVAHRNINLRHFLVSKCDQLKLCDFGQAIKFENDDYTCHDACGTPGYQAPELDSRLPYSADKVDIWALGVCLYTMVTGRHPFSEEQQQQQHRQQRQPLPLLRQLQPNQSPLLQTAPTPAACQQFRPPTTPPSLPPSSPPPQQQQQPAQVISTSFVTFRFPEEFVMPLSRQLKQLLGNMLIRNPKHRCTVNRVKYHEWLAQCDRGVFIGNFHLVRQPQKLRSSNSEKELKHSLEI